MAVTMRDTFRLGLWDAVEEDGGSFGVGVPAVAIALHKDTAGALKEGGGAVLDGETDDGVGAERTGLLREVSDDVLLQLVHDGLVDAVAAVVPGFLESTVGEMGGFPDSVCGKISEDTCRGMALNRWRRDKERASHASAPFSGSSGLWAARRWSVSGGREVPGAGGVRRMTSAVRAGM